MVTKIGEGDLNPGSPNEGEQTMPLSYKSFWLVTYMPLLIYLVVRTMRFGHFVWGTCWPI